VPTIVAKIFPSPGTMDKAEFNSAVDMADRTKICFCSTRGSPTLAPLAALRHLQVLRLDNTDVV